jgi:tetratricopeptide (TPR) repeat protein
LRQGRPARALGMIAVVILLAGVVAMGVYVVRATSPGAVGGGNPATAGNSPAAGTQPVSAEAADAVLNAAQDYINKGDHAKAEAVLKGAIAEHPEEQSFYVLHAELLSINGRFAEAYSNYEKALAIGPRTAAIELAAGVVATKLDRSDRAVEHFMAAQTANPTEYRAPLYLAAVQVKLREIDEAKKNYLLAAKLNPELATAWGALAELALQENRTELALQHIARARELQPQVTAWRLIEARALKRTGKAEQALQLLIHLNEAERRTTPIMQLIAECYGMLSRPMDAARMYAAASDDAPGNGQWAYEAALWFERAQSPQEGLPYARRAAALGVEGAEALLGRLSGQG